VKLAPRRAMQMAPGRVLRPVVALDIDGTLGYYHEHFIRFAAMYLQRSISTPWIPSREGEKFYQHVGVSKATYRQIKLAYRQGAQKRSMPIVPGAADLTRAVRKAGAEVWVCTTRPYLRLDNIDPDTRFWLRYNSIQYDGVLFGESKYRQLAQLVGSERIVAVLDDEVEQVRKAETVGVPAWLIDREYNQGKTCQGMSSLEAASKNFVDLIQKWLEKRGIGNGR
jgi:hypothetical protein